MHEDALCNKVLPLFQSGDITEASIDCLHGWMLELGRLCNPRNPSDCGQGSPKLAKYQDCLQQSWAKELPQLQAALSQELTRCVNKACAHAHGSPLERPAADRRLGLFA